MKKCVYCGTKAEDGAATCSSCGASDFVFLCEACGAEMKGTVCEKCGAVRGQQGGKGSGSFARLFRSLSGFWQTAIQVLLLGVSVYLTLASFFYAVFPDEFPGPVDDFAFLVLAFLCWKGYLYVRAI